MSGLPSAASSPSKTALTPQYRQRATQREHPGRRRRPRLHRHRQRRSQRLPHPGSGRGRP
jgi:hypothetical protein